MSLRRFRRDHVTRPIFDWAKKQLPSLSETERQAIDAGEVWWDAELFTGDPDWRKLLATAPARLSDKEQAFLDGPCEELCSMLHDWEITRAGDLPPQVWAFLKEKRFFGMIIPKEYGGLEFSAKAQTAVLQKLADEIDPERNWISVDSPLARGLLGKSLDVLEQCVAIDVSGDAELDGVQDAGGLSAWLGRRHQQRCEGAEATAPSAVLLTGPPAAGKSSLLNQIIVLTLNQSDTELIPILVRVHLTLLRDAARSQHVPIPSGPRSDTTVRGGCQRTHTAGAC